MIRSPARPRDDHLVRAALPLLIVGAVSFVVAYVVARDASHAAFGHLPLWGLFAAVGAVVTGGGATVIVAGRDDSEERPLYDPRRYILLPRDQYDRLVESSRAAPAAPPPPRSTPSPWIETEPARPASAPARPAAPPTAPRRAAAGPRTEFTPSPDFLPKVDDAIGEMEHLLEELRSESEREARILGVPDRAPPAPTSPPPPPPEAPRDRKTPRGAGTKAEVRAEPTPASSYLSRRDETPRPATPRPKAAAPRTPELETCTSCGRTLPASARTRPCAVCGGPMCAICLARARRAGTPETCPRCAVLLPESDEEDSPAPRRPR